MNQFDVLNSISNKNKLLTIDQIQDSGLTVPLFCEWLTKHRGLVGIANEVIDDFLSNGIYANKTNGTYILYLMIRSIIPANLRIDWIKCNKASIDEVDSILVDIVSTYYSIDRQSANEYIIHILSSDRLKEIWCFYFDLNKFKFPTAKVNKIIKSRR